MVQASGSAQSLVFSEILHSNLGQLSCTLFDEIAKDMLFVVPDQYDFTYAWYFCNSAETVPQDGVTCDIKEWLANNHLLAVISSFGKSD